MRTNIEIDDQLMADAMTAGRFKTKREAVEAGLALIKRQAAYQEILKLKGKLDWGWPEDERLKRRPNWYRVDAYGHEIPDVESVASGPAKKAVRGRR